MKKILIVDDEESFAYIVKMNLEETGQYKSWVQTNPLNALDTAIKINPDLILLDVLMPGKDGFEVLGELKDNKKTMRIPVIMLTGVEDKHAKIKAAEKYSEAYLVKPVTMQLLIERIEEVLKRRGMPPPAL